MGHYLKTINKTIIKMEKELNKKFIKIEGYTAEDVKQEIREILYIKMHYYFVNIADINKFKNNKIEQCRFYTFIKKSVANEIINRLKKQMVWDNTEKNYIFIDSKYKNLSLNANENLLIELLNNELYFNTSNISNNDVIVFFKENKNKLLTKKQLNYIDNINIVDVKHRNEYNKRISKRVLDAYEAYNNNYKKINKINKDLKLIDEILKQENINNVIKLVCDNLKNTIIDDLIFDLDTTSRKEIFKFINNNPVDYNKKINYKFIVEYLVKKEIELNDKLLKLKGANIG